MQKGEWIRQYDTMLRYYLHIDPDTLSDEEWAARIRELEWIRDQELKKSK